MHIAALTADFEIEAPSISVNGPAIHVTIPGLHSPEEMAEHFAEVAVVLEPLRTRGAAVRVFVDARHAPVQCADTAMLIGEHTARLFGARDRLAILLLSSLAKMQMRRVHTEIGLAARVEYFIGEDAARTWLHAH